MYISFSFTVRTPHIYHFASKNILFTPKAFFFRLQVFFSFFRDLTKILPALFFFAFFDEYETFLFNPFDDFSRFERKICFFAKFRPGVRTIKAHFFKRISREIFSAV